MTQQTALKWADVKTGSILRMVTHTGSPFHFLVMGVDPTYAGSPVAWVRGLKVTAAGKPVAQIDHLHMPERQREELANIADCKLMGALEVSPTNGKARRARKSAQ